MPLARPGISCSCLLNGIIKFGSLMSFPIYFVFEDHHASVLFWMFKYFARIFKHTKLFESAHNLYEYIKIRDKTLLPVNQVGG